MTNPFRPAVVVLLSLLAVDTQAQKIFVAGVGRAADCEFATQPLIRDLRVVHYPPSWTIVVACNRVVWDKLQRRAEAQGTDTGFTNIQHRITVLNGFIYLETLPLRGTAHDSPLRVLKHEYGHILCGCDDELIADRSGESNESK